MTIAPPRPVLAAGGPARLAAHPGASDALMPPVHASVQAACRAHRGADSLPLLFPRAVQARAQAFTRGFAGRVLYAVKCNPDPAVLRLLYAGGVRDFDVASLAELRSVRACLPDARLHFMHPIKAPEAIVEAWRMGVRTFVVDHHEELQKVARLVRSPDLLILVRLAVVGRHARYALGGKFGASADDAVDLLRAAAAVTRRLGVCFHVGSQCLDPGDYAAAIAQAAQVARRAAVTLRVLDVGGGFPSRYPGMEPPPDAAYFAAIDAAIAATGLADVRAWAEPGRSLVADGGGLLARVEARRGGDLYLNDGVFGSLYDAGAPGWRFPTRMLRPSLAAWMPFRIFGPSCDSADMLRHPIDLPADVRAGDWLEFGQIGAYGTALGTRFNGFAPSAPVLVLDDPLIDRAPHGAPWRDQ